MNFQEAQSTLNAGGKVARRIWEPGTYLTNEDGHPVKKLPTGETEEGYSTSPYDIHENDWDVVEFATEPEAEAPQEEKPQSEKTPEAGESEEQPEEGKEE